MQSSNHDFFCVGVMYSGEYDSCDVTLSVYPHRASLKMAENVTYSNRPDRVAQLAEPGRRQSIGLVFQRS